MVDRYPYGFEDREPYRAKTGAVRFAVPNNKRETSKFANVYLYTVPILLRYREPYNTSFGAVRIALRFAVLNSKRITVLILVRYGSRSNTKMRTVKVNGSVRFSLLTIGQKNGTVTVALAVKNGTVKKTENGTDTVRYGNGTVPSGDGDKFGRTIGFIYLVGVLK